MRGGEKKEKVTTSGGIVMKVLSLTGNISLVTKKKKEREIERKKL